MEPYSIRVYPVESLRELYSIGVHCLVTGCELSSSGELKPAVKDFLLPYDVIKDAFRIGLLTFRPFRGKNR